MPKFNLKTEQILQGEFEIKRLNVILIFQVNCPGCFIYALPLAAKLHEKYGDRLNVLGLSTAFEDFELNTAENTQKLLESGEMVGVTQAYFQQQQVERYPTPLNFPFAFDRETFYLNPLQGTPSWIVFDQEYNILTAWFGHKPEVMIEPMIQQLLQQSENQPALG